MNSPSVRSLGELSWVPQMARSTTCAMRRCVSFTSTRKEAAACEYDPPWWNQHADGALDACAWKTNSGSHDPVVSQMMHTQQHMPTQIQQLMLLQREIRISVVANIISKEKALQIRLQGQM